MATIRWSIGVHERTDQVVQATGAAVVTKPIELTVDVDALIAAGIKGTQLQLQIHAALQRIEDYIQQGNHGALPA